MRAGQPSTGEGCLWETGGARVAWRYGPLCLRSQGNPGPHSALTDWLTYLYNVSRRSSRSQPVQLSSLHDDMEAPTLADSVKL